MTDVILLGLDDVPEIVALHSVALADDILPAFGPDVLARFYTSILSSDNAFAIGVRDSAGLAGFMLVALGAPSFFDLARIPLSTLASKTTALLLRRPLLIADALISAFQSGMQPEAECEISYIAVAPRCQGQGTGRRLVDGLRVQMAVRNIMVCRTKTLSENRHVVRLYQRAFAEVKVVGGYKSVRRSYVFLLLHRGELNTNV